MFVILSTFLSIFIAQEISAASADTGEEIR
jgi:hypothetical protein